LGRRERERLPLEIILMEIKINLMLYWLLFEQAKEEQFKCIVVVVVDCA
jgi:hypothetical protein